MPDNAAVNALMLTAAFAVLVLVLLAPAIRARTGPVLPEKARNQRIELLLASLATAPARRDGFVDARTMVWECGRNGRERYQLVRDLVERDWVETRGRAGLALIPAFLRLTSTGWWEWSYRRAVRTEVKPAKPPPTVTYLNFRRLVPTGGRGPGGGRTGSSPPDHDGVADPGAGGTGAAGDTGDTLMFGPSEQHLRELYVALRADAENILARGLRQDALDRADEVERAVAEPDPKKRWSAVDQVGPLVALDQANFTLTVMVLKRLLT